MPSALTRTDICNVALAKLGPGGGFITDYDTDETVQGQTCRKLYEATRDLVIEAHPWRFARARAALTDPDPAAWGFSLQYELPDDFLRLLSVEPGPIEYEIEGAVLLTDAGAPLNIRYLARVEDETLFTPSFIAALATKLAAEAAPSLTQNNRQRNDLLVEFEQVALAQARKTDRFGAAPARARDGSWNDARR